LLSLLKGADRLINIALIDDDMDFHPVFCRHVENFFREKEKLHELWLYNSPAEAVYDLKNGKHWDLYFLDIEMPEMDGFELAGKIRKEAPEAYLVFLTSHEELAAEGYNYKELSYIPKSLLEDNMDRTLQRFWTEYHSTYNKTYRIVTDTRFEQLEYDDIIYLYREKNNTVFVLKDREVRIRKSLKAVFDDLGTDGFLFVERGYVVNIEHIVRLVNKEIVVRNGETLPIGRTYEIKVKNAILHFWKDRI